MNAQKLSLLAVGRPLSQPHDSNNFGAVVSTVLSAFFDAEKTHSGPDLPFIPLKALLFLPLF